MQTNQEPVSGEFAAAHQIFSWFNISFNCGAALVKTLILSYKLQIADGVASY